MTRGESCQACGRPYATVYAVPDEVWAEITPAPGRPGGGLLCICCADQRAADLDVVLTWTAEVLT